MRYCKHEYITEEETLPSDQRRVIEQAKFTYFPPVKIFEKRTKTIQDHREKQIKTLEKHGKQLIMSSLEKNLSHICKKKKDF